MKQLLDRKEAERDLHDHLRGELRDDPHYNSNAKFYAISQLEDAYRKQWLAARCKGKRVLDYCCGNGHFTLWLAEAGADVVGIDISPVSIANATKQADQKQLSDRVKFLVMDAEATSFPNDHFDLAVVNGVLHHLDLEKAYGELSRVLKPEGAVICTEALRHNLFIHCYRKMTPHLRSAWETEHILGKDEIARAKRYFEKVEIIRFFHLATLAAVPFRKTQAFAKMLKALEAVDSVLLQIPLLQRQAWMAVFVLSHPQKPVAM